MYNTDKLIWIIIKTSFSKKTIGLLMNMTLAIIIRMKIDMIISSYINTRYYILNFIIQVLISVSLILNSNYIFDFLKRFEKETYMISRYLINNYTPEKFVKWKRIVIGCISVYMYIIFSLIDISNDIVKLYILQYVTSFIIIDLYEHYMKSINVGTYIYNDDKIYNELTVSRSKQNSENIENNDANNNKIKDVSKKQYIYDDVELVT
jgi:hypothetical protein